MSFFEPPEIPEEPELHTPISPPGWIGPPRNVLGESVAGRVILVQREDLIIAVTSMVAYPVGVRFTLLTRTATDQISGRLSGRRWMHDMDGAESGTLPDEMFRLGVETADGRAFDYRPAGISGIAGFGYGEGDAPDPPQLHASDGHGGSGEWEQRYWLWPLPPDGPFEFVCEWPAMNVGETHATADLQAIREAAERAIVLWDEVAGPGDHPWTY